LFKFVINRLRQVRNHLAQLLTFTIHQDTDISHPHSFNFYDRNKPHPVEGDPIRTDAPLTNGAGRTEQRVVSSDAEQLYETRMLATRYEVEKWDGSPRPSYDRK